MAIQLHFQRQDIRRDVDADLMLKHDCNMLRAHTKDGNNLNVNVNVKF